uniref:Uncharacterized protein n=1 Tax=Oryza meridionalis TaxID=40149 RepID=A0A0E0EBD2_9ORYZ
MLVPCAQLTINFQCDSFNIFDGAECNIPNHELLVDRCLIGVILLLPQTGNEIHEIDICMTSGMVIFFVECSFKNLHLFV